MQEQKETSREDAPPLQSGETRVFRSAGHRAPDPDNPGSWWTPHLPAGVTDAVIVGMMGCASWIGMANGETTSSVVIDGQSRWHPHYSAMDKVRDLTMFKRVIDAQIQDLSEGLTYDALQAAIEAGSGSVVDRSEPPGEAVSDG